MTKTNKIKFLIEFSPNTYLTHQVLTAYTSLFYKDFAIGSMFHSGERKNKFSLNVIEGSKFEAYLKQKVGAIVKSDSETYKVAWLDLSKETDFEKLEEIVVELPKFEDAGLRKLYEQH